MRYFAFMKLLLGVLAVLVAVLMRVDLLVGLFILSGQSVRDIRFDDPHEEICGLDDYRVLCNAIGRRPDSIRSIGCGNILPSGALRRGRFRHFTTAPYGAVERNKGAPSLLALVRLSCSPP